MPQPKEKKARKQLYRVFGYADLKGNDIMVQVSAATPDAAREAAVKERPELAKMKDVRVYTRMTQWMRVQ